MPPLDWFSVKVYAVAGAVPDCEIKMVAPPRVIVQLRAELLVLAASVAEMPSSDGARNPVA